MSVWHEYVQREGTVPEWPYPVNYGKVNEVVSDVLIVGGGVAGLRAAISAAQLGAKVALIDAGHAKRSGMGGAGVDHWHGAVTNPCSKVTPQEYTQACYDSMGGYIGAHTRYVVTNESWDTLLECEKWGLQIRDVRDEFKGAPFRDEETKLLFAYDYDNRHVLRVWGWNIKPVVYNEAKRLGVNIQNRICATSLLTEGGKQGARIVGATGVNTRTGEFYVFQAKATVIATGGTNRLYNFMPEVTASSSMQDMTSAGVGHTIGWKAGAELILMENTTMGMLSGFGYAPYSMGNCHNSFHGAPIVDAEGKEVPWADPFGNQLQTQEERFRCAPGQPFQLCGGGWGVFPQPQYGEHHLVFDLPERIFRGEYVLPLYTDLTRLPEHERRVLWGMMVGNEGKTRIPVYDAFAKAGFDPDKDLLQAPVMSPDGYRMGGFWEAGIVNAPPNIRSAAGTYLVDWDLRTSLEGLYAASGQTVHSRGGHGESHTMGRYAGRKAAEYAKTAPVVELAADQIEAERARVYGWVRTDRDGIGWKEINMAICRLMKDYCGQYKNEITLKAGLRLLDELRKTELADAHASNPHELGRMIECSSLIDFGEAMLHASLARKASSRALDFYRFDYPEVDPPEWDKLLAISQADGKVLERLLPLDYYLKPPFAPTYEENYNAHRWVGDTAGAREEK